MIYSAILCQNSAMVNRCADCGADLGLVGIRHRCIPRGGSVAGGSRAPVRIDAPVESQAAAKKSEASAPAKKRRHLPTEVHLSTSGVTSSGAISRAKAVADGATERRSTRKRKYRGGRPIKGQEQKTIRASQPWVKEGISERTWWRREMERRRAEGKA